MIDSTVATAFPPHPRHTLHEPLEDRTGVRCSCGTTLTHYDVLGDPYPTSPSEAFDRHVEIVSAALGERARTRVDVLAEELSTPSLTITRDDLTAAFEAVTA